MSNAYKIGVGVITFNRPDSLRKLIDSLPHEIISSLIIVNDGDDNATIDNIADEILVVKTTGKIGVGCSKNIALRQLMSSDVDHLFIIEDDVYIKDVNVFWKYIETAKMANYQHMNFSQHGRLNKDAQGNSIPKMSISFNHNCVVDYHGNCVGAFSYYTKNYINVVGYINEEYYNAVEHIAHTYAGVMNDLHPPFWYFADISKSEKYIGEYEPWSLEQSEIFKNFDVTKNFNDGLDIFESEYGVKLLEVQELSLEEAKKEIKSLFLSTKI